MPSHEWVLPAIIALPLLASPLAGLLYRSRSAQAWLAMSALEIAAVLSLWLLTLIAAGQRHTITFASAVLIDLHFDLAFAIDELSGLFVIVLLLVGLGNVMFYATRGQTASFRGYQEPLVLLALFAALAAVASANLLTFYVFWQLMVFCETVLMAAGPAGRSLRSVLKYVVANEISALLIFFAVGLTYAKGTGGDLTSALAVADLGFRDVLLGLLLAAGLLGSGVFPLHTWFTGAVEAGPPALASYVLGTQNKLGLFLLARLAIANLENGLAAVPVIVAVFGALSVVGGAMGALVWRETRGSLALLMVAQTGYVLLGLGTGERLGLAGAFYLVLGQSLALVVLWLSLESVRTRVAEPDSLGGGGLAKAMPLAAAGYTVGALSLVGVPLLPGYIGQALVYRGLFASGEPWREGLVAAGVVGSLLSAAVLARLGRRVFLGPGQPATQPVTPANGLAQGSLALLGVVLLAVGILPGLVAEAMLSPIVGLKFLGGWGDLIYPLRAGRAVVLWTVPLTIVLLVLPLALVLLSRAAGRRPAVPAGEEIMPFVPGRLAESLSAADAVVPNETASGPLVASAAGWLAKSAHWNLDPYELAGRLIALLSVAVARVVRLTFRVLVG
ncbi:MAG: complex I subunit 5 family protein [Chloroflexota bacterium]